VRKGKSTVHYECRGGAGEILCALLLPCKLPSPLLVISLADRSQAGQGTGTPGLSSPLPAVPHTKGCWWAEPRRLLLPRHPLTTPGACGDQPSHASQASALPWVALYGTSIQIFSFPSFQTQRTRQLCQVHMRRSAIPTFCSKDAIYHNVRLFIISYKTCTLVHTLPPFS